MYASWILKRFRFPLVVVSGGGGLAEGMASLLQAQGVPAQNIALENQSDSTTQNARYVKALLQKRFSVSNSATVAILTSDFHCWRARRAFERVGLPVRVIPVPDVVKRCGSWPYRLEGLVVVSTELAKDSSLLFSH
jgi:uncharacterized SAM-binding protein YcdF (DUF218 family)